MKWQFLSRNLALLTLAGAIGAYFFPAVFLVFKAYFLWLFAATMFALGLVMKPEEAKEALAKPGTVMIGVAAQFSVMPALGFGAAMLSTWYGVPASMALGFIIVGCAPGAMASNVISYLLGGAIAFSIAMTMLATTLSPLLTPLLVDWLGGALMDIPFWPMMKTILLTVVLPLLMGMIIHHRLPQYQKYYQQVAPDLAALAIIIICSYAVAANQERIAQTPWIVFALVVVLNAGGYLAGWFIGGACNFDKRYRITLAIEIGMQNAGLGVVLALKHFSPEAALPGALFAVWCILTAAGLGKLKGMKGLKKESISAAI